MRITVERLEQNPIITMASSSSLGDNINGPSLIRVPDGTPGRLGQYYLYFSHHLGQHIRLAYSDTIEGPWTVHEAGALRLSDSLYPTEIQPDDIAKGVRERIASSGRPLSDFIYAHIASPDVVVDETSGEIRMYYHGMLANGSQATRVAVSRDGLNFRPLPDIIARPYLRMFKGDDAWYGMAMPGFVYRSADGLTGFEEGPQLFDNDMRHAALLRDGNRLFVFWTHVGDAPERILLSQVDLSVPWQSWIASEPIEVLRPEEDWEGASIENVASVRGAIHGPANQLRDPAIYEENGNRFLIYSVAGESGLAIARVEIDA